MKLKTSMVLTAAALGLAFGAAQAADEKAARDAPGFNELDKDDDGALTRAEAAGNPALAARFSQVDRDGDGKLSRFEYLRTVTAQDLRRLREKAASFIEPDDKASAGATAEKRK